MDTLQNAPDVLTVEEVASLLKVSKKTIYGLLRSGELPHRKIGRIFRISKPALVSYLKNH